MDNDQTPAPENDELLEPDDSTNLSAASATPDPNDEIPVPIAMFPSEIDERAQVVDSLRKEANTNRDEDLGLQP